MSSGLADHLRRLREIGWWDVPGDERRRRALLARVHRRLLLHAATLGIASALVAASMTVVVIREGGGDDLVPPVLVRKAVEPSPVNGWYSGAVTVAWSCYDDRSGRTEHSRDVPAELEGKGQHVGVECRDDAGNRARGVFVLDIDRTAPTGLVVSPHPPPNATRWYRAPLTVEWTCSDEGSGVANPSPSPRPVADEGKHSVASGCIDVAGNEDRVPVHVYLDLSAPKIGEPVVDPPANRHGWHRSPVAVRWPCTDDLSGVRFPTAADRVAGEGPDLVARATCEDLAGNTSAGEWPLLIDMKPPHMTAALRPSPNAAGWNNEPVEVTFSCADEISGVLSIAPRTVTIDGAGKDREVESRCNDRAGNGRILAEAVSIDLVAPTVRIDDPDVPVLTGDQRITGSASDDLSGVRSVKVTFTNRLNSRRHVETGRCSAGCTSWSAALPPCSGPYDVSAISTDVADNESDSVGGPTIVVGGDPGRCSSPLTASSAPADLAAGSGTTTERPDRPAGRPSARGDRAEWRAKASVRDLDDGDHRRADDRDHGRRGGHHGPPGSP